MEFKNKITIASLELLPIRATGGVSPDMALGAMPTRPALLVRITDSDGCYGWGEVWANFPPRANTHKAHIIEDVVAPALIGVSFTDPREIQQKLRESFSVYFLHVGQSQVFEHIIAGLDTALWDLALRKANLPFRQFMEINQSSAPTYASSINTGDLETLIPKHAALGQTHFKVKIGFLSDDDRDLVNRATALFPDGSRMMVDSNQAWNLTSAKEALHNLECNMPFFAEEPIPANAPLEEWSELARSTNIPLACGENVYGVDNFLSLANAGVKVLQPDVAKWGGVTGALDLADAITSDTIIWPHFMGSAVGQMAALSVTAAIGESSVCEMDVNQNRLRTELCGDVLNIEHGSVELVSDCGLVVEPCTDCLQEFADNHLPAGH